MSLLMVRLAIWQFDRLEERKESVAALRGELSGPGIAIASAADMTAAGPGRKVVLDGTVGVTHWIYVRNVLHEGIRGFYELVPITLTDGSVVVVNAGFLEEQSGKDDRSEPLLPPRPVRVIGLTRNSETSGGQIAERQYEGTGNVPTVTAVDTNKLATASGSEVAGLWVQQLEPRSEVPIPLPSPDLSEGPHFAYALQWLSFTAIITVGYGVLLFRVRRDQGLVGT